MMTYHSFSQLLVVSLCLVITVTGQHTPFKVGIGVENGVELTAVCTEDENAFIKKTIQKYIIGLGRLFFQDETFELPHPLQDLDGSHFAAEAFSDFNAYEVEKYGGAGVGGEVQVSVTDRPSYSPAPSATPSQMSLEVFVHLDDTDAPVATPTTTVEAVSAKSEVGAEAPVNAETMSPITQAPATGAPLTVAPVASAPVVEARVPESNGIPLPCCGRIGDDGCSAPSNTFCHAEAGQCTGQCSGIWHTVSSLNISMTARPTPSPSAAPVPSAPVDDSNTASQPSNAPSACEDGCVMLDFEKYSDGSNVNRGDYVSNDWRAEYGVRFKATGYYGGTTPVKEGAPDLTEARIFDSSVPSSVNKDLGSPNEMCQGGGPGTGVGGEPGAQGENCEPLGNVLIIQDSKSTEPNEHYWGGEFWFYFDEPVDFNSIGLLDVSYNSKPPSVTVKTSDNSQYTISVPVLGKNSIQTLLIPHSQVISMKVYMPEQAAISHLSWCRASCAGTVASRRGRRLGSGAESNHLRGLRGRRSPASFVDTAMTANTVTEDAPATDEVDIPERRELLGIKFLYGGQGEYTCYLCNPDNFDRRQLLFTRKFLVSSLETIMSFGLTADMKWNYKDFLSARNETIGCLGNGDGIRVIMELTAVRPVAEF